SEGVRASLPLGGKEESQRGLSRPDRRLHALPPSLSDRLPYGPTHPDTQAMGNTLPNPHDTLFKALLEDPERAGTLLRESLPKALTDKMAGDPRPGRY
ncbi:Rpn family recombination-promoting nuclease/putative transposase, partial [Ectothiorhodospira variabilis]|uniref:Rpn family recombination-promoting nuclease/putative transposase n=1 Tax=Ectothiorhodospira variabilis TaxID=505694 RepID=UPI001EFA86B7